MIERVISYLAKSKITSKIKFDKFLNDLPNDFFLDNYNAKRIYINGAIIFLSMIFAIISMCVALFFDIFLGFLVLIVVFLASVLFLVRRIRKKYLNLIFEVEQYSDLICREIFLILSTTRSLSMVLEYLSQGSYPIISPMIQQILKKTNIGSSPESLLKTFALKQPSETIKDFVLEIVLPMANGNLELKSTMPFETQWRIRKSFDSYLSQLEGKMSIFLAITTIIPITISMLLVMLGHISLSLLIFLPLIFFVFDLVAIEIFNSGKIKLLGG